MNDSAELLTHALLYFKTDHTVCTLPVKRILQPPQPQVVVGCPCTVRWSGRKQYAATVLCLGRNLTGAVFTDFNMLPVVRQVMQLQLPGSSMSG